MTGRCDAMGGNARDARGVSRRRARHAVESVLFRATDSFARLRATRRASNVVDGARSGGEAATWILAATDRAGDSATRLATRRRDGSIEDASDARGGA